jgi:hypothetical protein
VVDGAGIFYSERTGHNSVTVARREANVNSKDLTLGCSMRFSVRQKKAPPYGGALLRIVQRSCYGVTTNQRSLTPCPFVSPFTLSPLKK